MLLSGRYTTLVFSSRLISGRTAQQLSQVSKNFENHTQYGHHRNFS